MKQVEQLFDSEFVLKLQTEFGGGYYASKVNLDVVTKSGKDESMRKMHKHTTSGKFIDGGYYSLGNKSKETEYYNSVGKLAVVPIYIQKDDDMMAMYYSVPVGYAIVDKNQEIIYKNTKTADNVLTNKYDVLKMLYKYGPCALSFLNPQDFDNRDFVNSLKEIYKQRVNTLKSKNKDIEKISKEFETFNKAVNILENENMKVNYSEVEF